MARETVKSLKELIEKHAEANKKFREEIAELQRENGELRKLVNQARDAQAFLTCVINFIIKNF